MSLQQSAKSIWKMMISDSSFTKNLNKVKIVAADKGKCIAEMKVSQEHSNLLGTLHGGLTATIVDNISTLALVTYERPAVGVSVDLHITYLKAAHIGEELVITANTLKSGKTLAFLDVLITKKNGGEIIAKGTHTKYVGAESILPKLN